VGVWIAPVTAQVITTLLDVAMVDFSSWTHFWLFPDRRDCAAAEASTNFSGG
jgi:hypothetical protein